MAHNYMVTAQEISDELTVSMTSAYKIIRRLNDELREKGFLTVPGKTSRKYFLEQIYGATDCRQEGGKA